MMKNARNGHKNSGFINDYLSIMKVRAQKEEIKDRGRSCDD